jgi:mRNA interferase RelE/StbE
VAWAGAKVELSRRLRLGTWRILYAVIETEALVVAVVAVRRRPPYDYGDLPEPFESLPRNQ